MATKKKNTDKGKTLSKPTAKKSVVKAGTTTKSAPKKAAAKPAAKKVAAKPVAKKAAAKPVAKKAAAKPVAKKAAAKPVAKKAAAKPVAKKAAAKPVVKKAAAKPVAKKAVGKPVAKKAVVKKPEIAIGASKTIKGKAAEKVKPVKAGAKTEKNSSVPLEVDKSLMAKTTSKAGSSRRRAGRLPKPKVEKAIGIRDTEETHPELKKPASRPEFSSPYNRRVLATRPVPVKQKEDNRSRYSDEELLEFKGLIIQKLTEARKDFDLLKDSLSNKTNGTDDTSPTFKLLEDGSDVLTKEETAQLAVRQQKFIQNLENALIRIENKTYGICRATGKLISKDRLRVVPHATLSIEAKNAQ
ncbi:MAG TPA: TraR/DksA C4-type zinc finger protein [Bacteroidia bacterium]|nr:TraR/DksA C4-type zinc finger protein [Bacteroidia bacterium]